MRQLEKKETECHRGENKSAQGTAHVFQCPVHFAQSGAEHPKAEQLTTIRGERSENIDFVGKTNLIHDGHGKGHNRGEVHTTSEDEQNVKIIREMISGGG